MKVCREHNRSNKHILDAIIPRNHHFDLKVMIVIGLLKFKMDYQRDEILLLLQSRGIEISTGEISLLSQEFLLHFYCVQKRQVADLRTVIDTYILHLDGTGEAGKEIVFMAKEGKTGITIDAASMQSESVEYIVPFLTRIKTVFDNPIAIVRDMSGAIQTASSEVFPNVLQLICQFHFVRSLGDTIFADYSDFKNCVVKTKALSSISKIRIEHNGEGIRWAEALWVGVASEYILHPRELSSKFPFSLQYVDIFDRCIEVRELGRKIVAWNMSQNVYCTPLMDLCAALDMVTKNEDVKTGYRAFQKLWEWFELIRKTLRVGRELNSNTTKEPICSESTRKDLISTINEIVYQGGKYGGYLGRKSLIFKNRVDAHIDELVSSVFDSNGKTVDVVRHNGVEEVGHRWSRMHIRRRTGRSQTSAEMALYGPLLAMLSNIDNKFYVENVLNKIDFVAEIASVSEKELNEARKLVRQYVKHCLVSDDYKRKPILHKLVDMMEKGLNVEKCLDDWLSCVQVKI